MNTTKRILILLLALTMCFLAACGGDEEPQKDPDPLTLLANELSEYKIIFDADGEKWVKPFATRVKTTIKTATGVDIPIEEDNKVATPDANAKEIIIATPEINRASTYTAKGGVNLGYNIFVDGNRLIFEVYSKTGAFFALSQFAKDQFGFDMEAGQAAKRVEGLDKVIVAYNYTKTRTLDSNEFPYIGIPFEDFQIAYHGDYYIHKCIAKDLQTELAYMCGAELDVWDIAFGPDEGQRYISFVQNDEMNKGDWKITFTTEGIEIAANGYYGFEAAVPAFADLQNTNGYFDLKNNESVSGNYLDTLGKAERFQPTKYAYNNLGEYRVMFYNALFWDTYTYDDGTTNYHPAKERNRVQYEMFAEYMPDVLGLQEFNSSKRYDAGMYDLVDLLATLGYKEAIDPIVDNASREEYMLWSVFDENGKRIGYRPNPNAATTVYGTPVSKLNPDGNYDFETTYINHTPLFYNEATTKLIDAGYYWYENQWDLGELTEGEFYTSQDGNKKGASPITGNYFPSTHENGIADAASKSLTWGVFESLETGERYIAISTHMCTRSDKIRGLQAKEAVALISELVEEYNYPVLFGGDMNGKSGNLNYDYFVSDEVGYKSLQDHDLADTFTSNLLSSHGYPGHTAGVLTTGGAPSVMSKKGMSIDQIFTTNHSNVTFKVYGIIADMCSLRGSDHLPLFVDFTIN